MWCFRIFPLATISLAGMLGCGGDLSLPSGTSEGLSLSIVDGNGQTGTVGQELPEPLIVEVESGGTPIPGHQIAFVVSGDAAAGRLEPDTAVTGEDGRALTHWVLGSVPGSHEVEAKLVVTEPAPPPTAVFEASAIAGDPDTVRAVSPVSQPGRIGRPVPEAPTVMVLDHFGNPVLGAEVTWDVTSGGGTVSSPTTMADATGEAMVTWTLGIGIGVQKVSARVDGAHGSPVLFTATVLF
jgi:hypothetical protein